MMVINIIQFDGPEEHVTVVSVSRGWTHTGVSPVGSLFQLTGLAGCARSAVGMLLIWCTQGTEGSAARG